MAVDSADFDAVVEACLSIILTSISRLFELSLMPRVSESLSLYSLIENIRATNEAVSQSLFFGDFGSAFDPAFSFISLVDPVVPPLVWLIIGLPVDSVIGSFCVVSVLYLHFLVRIYFSFIWIYLALYTNIYNEL